MLFRKASGPAALFILNGLKANGRLVVLEMPAKYSRDRVLTTAEPQCPVLNQVSGNGPRSSSAVAVRSGARATKGSSVLTSLCVLSLDREGTRLNRDALDFKAGAFIWSSDRFRCGYFSLSWVRSALSFLTS